MARLAPCSSALIRYGISSRPTVSSTTARSPRRSRTEMKSRIRMGKLQETRASEARGAFGFLPRREPCLDALDDLDCHDAQQGHDDDRDEHLGRLEEVAVLDDHAAEAGDRREELGHDHRENAATHGQAQSR